ncbi:hypothetical protein A8B82_11760 [Sulfitobacter sp. EhC04]|uniref:hypothetical protein n=1 Tax=Sulfitobacter sp. EhC04 TaxID=1849168 RepID=UPI0007F5117B|nr:hypothetical protein [Sulfitobacter sp. EhC04]OAN77878.1 hypothetical protein A8B82_11760 [Sulfitobacter sp. EhC04]
MKKAFYRTSTIVAAGALMTMAGAASAQQVFATDVIVQGSLCVGMDCSSSENFGFDTLRLKENNLRVHFDDTSASASFPSNDWRILINDTGNGGGNYFAIDDATSGRSVFRIEAGAISNAMYIDGDGDVGLGTSNPVVELHAVDGNTPTLRLEQDGSSGFTAQTWDLAGNETNFFIRDVTNASKLPFRIRPNSPEDSIYIKEGQGDIGMGTDSPQASLHVRRTSTTNAALLVEAATADATLELKQAGTVASTWEFRNQQDSGRLNIGVVGGNTPIKIDNTANNNLMRIGRNGLPDEVNITGRLVINNTQVNVPDYVFADDYVLRPLADVRAFIDTNSHLPEVPSEAHIKANGVDLTEMQMVLLKKVEELTLYTLEQEDVISTQQAKLADVDALRAELAEIKALLSENR